MKRVSELTLQEQDDFKNVMNTQSGRAFVWRILDVLTGFNGTAFANNAGIYCNVGKQDVGRSIYDEIMVLCPDLYMKMRNEAIQKEIANEKAD